MHAPNNLRQVLSVNQSVTVVEDDIYSVLSNPLTPHQYDGRAAVYDALVNSRLYGRLAWGSLPNDYVSFVRESLASSSDGRFLDAGCGSLIFAAPSYLQSNRQIIAFDQSLAMLRRARKRLRKLAGAVPEHIVLLQGDLADLPFQPKSFPGVLCLNVLHHIQAAAALIGNLKALLTDEGHLNLTSLVYNHRFAGDLYLRALHLSGAFARPRSSLELRQILERALSGKVAYRLKGNMAYASYGRGWVEER